MPDDIPPEVRAKLEAVKDKRPKTVIDHILQYGYITNIDLNQKYGYDHPPRAIRDVRELGIPLENFKVPGPGKKMITAYRFPTDMTIEEGKQGRRSFPKKLKHALLSRDGEQCQICKRGFPGNVLQIDHKVPYEVSGDKADKLNTEEFMLLCGSCNRAKSWGCEHCDNWIHTKSVFICSTCMFANPDNYEHIAMQQKRSLTLNWSGEEVQDYDLLKQQAYDVAQNVEEYVKDVLKSRLQLDQTGD